jgi:hypothetical protein
MVRTETADLGEGAGSGFVAVLLDEESRSLGEDEHSTEEDEGVCELDGDGNTVRACVITTTCGVVDDGCE